MGEPVKAGTKLREMLHGVFLRQYEAGARFRTREKRLADILAMVRREFPDALQENLVGDELEFLKAERSDSECAYYREQYRCPRECGNLGKLWMVVRKDTTSGPIYTVGYQMCGKYLAWREERRREREQRELKPEAATAIAPFSTKGGRRYEPDD